MTFSQRVYLLLACLSCSGLLLSQEDTTEKNIVQETQTWVSLNTVFQFSTHWSALGDIHIRRSDLLRNPSFNFLRFGMRYGINDNLKVSAGYAHLWLARDENWTNYLNENRVYQELIAAETFNKFSAVFRIRNEQRFFNNVEDGATVGENYFINRLRFLFSISIPFKPESKTAFLLANEVHLNFGSEVVFNTFDQNRFTVGIKHQLSKAWSFDLGYMLVYQQLLTGVDYNLNHTLRLFFYGNFDVRKNKNEEELEHGQTID